MLFFYFFFGTEVFSSSLFFKVQSCSKVFFFFFKKHFLLGTAVFLTSFQTFSSSRYINVFQKGFLFCTEVFFRSHFNWCFFLLHSFWYSSFSYLFSNFFSSRYINVFQKGFLLGTEVFFRSHFNGCFFLLLSFWYRILFWKSGRDKIDLKCTSNFNTTWGSRALKCSNMALKNPKNRKKSSFLVFHYTVHKWVS